MSTKLLKSVLRPILRRVVGLPPRSQHAAAVQPDAKRGEVILLFSTDGALTRERLQEEARRSGQPELAIPRRVVHLDTVPLLGSGKIDHVSLQRMAESA